MARIQNGILGGGRGKVSNVIMGIWKGIDYLKAYAVPANPQSPAQQANRAPWGSLARLYSLFNIVFIQAYFRSARPRMSGFNAFMQANIEAFRSGTAAPFVQYLNNPSTNAFPEISLGVVQNTATETAVSIPADVAEAGDRLVLMQYEQPGANPPTTIEVVETELTAGQTAATVTFGNGYTVPGTYFVAFLIKGLRTTEFTKGLLS
jgi:Family of unknown function (DUF6266)